MVEPRALLPFIPGGSDFALSRQLFCELGGSEERVSEGYVTFRWGQARFILQDFNDPAFASNLMMRLEVADLDQWWSEIEPKQLAAKFAGFRIKAPASFPWGREVNFIDLAGVCWHVG